MNHNQVKRKVLLKSLKRKEPFIHLLFWVSYVLFPYLKSIGRDTVYHFQSELIDLLFGMIVFYISYAVFLTSKNKFGKVVFLLLLFCVIGFFNLEMHNWLFRGTHTEAFWYYSINYISTYSILSLFGYVLFLMKKGYRSQQLFDEMNAKKKESELANLKSQINPHFLFNTLNSIYLSALKKEDNTADLILKLSNNFRYVLQDGQDKQVTIKKEITHIRDYLSLQKERLKEKVVIDFNITVDNYEEVISPLLLISFIENAIKYTSMLRGKKHHIKIDIQLEQKSFYFSCQNPCLEENSHMDLDSKSNGIGIENTTKRLEYLYPNKHSLRIHKKNNLFNVDLKIAL